MNIQTAAKYMDLGYRITRPGLVYHPFTWLYGDPITLTLEELLADDWEIIKDGIVEEFPVLYEDEA